MRRGPLELGLAAMLTIALSACVAPGEPRMQDLAPGQRPSLETDEAGLWLMSDRMEEAVKDSGAVVRDPELNAYISDIVCRLAPSHCTDVRVHIVRAAGFNASMAPNGYMQVWTGLLLRTENEAQLAYVLGHELSHYLKRHSVKRWRDLRSTTDAAAFFQLITAGAGVGALGQVGNLIALSSIYGFSREQEREADNDGLDMHVRAGYDPLEAPKIWQGLLEERDAEKTPARSIFFATHPTPESRLRALTERATLLARDLASPVVGAERHASITNDYRAAWFDDELPKRELAAALVLLERLDRRGEDRAFLGFARGEVYRLRREEGDDQRALASYARAEAAGGAPSELHRSIGMVRWRSGDHAGARAAFETYLKKQPDAPDRMMVQSYIAQLPQ